MNFIFYFSLFCLFIEKLYIHNSARKYNTDFLTLKY